MPLTRNAYTRQGQHQPYIPPPPLPMIARPVPELEALIARFDRYKASTGRSDAALSLMMTGSTGNIGRVRAGRSTARTLAKLDAFLTKEGV